MHFCLQSQFFNIEKEVFFSTWKIKLMGKQVYKINFLNVKILRFLQNRRMAFD